MKVGDSILVLLVFLAAGQNAIAQTSNPQPFSRWHFTPTTATENQVQSVTNEFAQKAFIQQALSSQRSEFPSLIMSPNTYVASDPFEYLALPEVLQELEVLDYQVQELKELRKKRNIDRQRITDAYKYANSSKNRLERYRANLEKHNKYFDSELRSVLLPKQNEQLIQIAAKKKLAARGLNEFLKDPTIAKSLGISNGQLSTLRDLATKQQADFQKRAKAMKIEYQKKLIASLKPEQQQKLKQLIGK